MLTIGQVEDIRESRRQCGALSKFFTGSKDITRYAAARHVFLRNTLENISTRRLLQPLPISDQVWTDITMYFIKG